MQRIAWFSPMPPVRSGIARCSADLVAALADEYVIDVYVDEAVERASPARSAHDFVWQHREAPYDLVVYQLGNSSNHDYIWPYLFRFPGLTVLHDGHLHHARAAALLRTKRTDDYRAEFAASHPDASPDAAELAVAGFDNHLYYMWPMTRLAVQVSRLTAVHTPRLAAQLREEVPRAAVEAIRLGHGVALTETARERARADVRRRYAFGDEVIVGCFGGLMPEKRIPQVLDAFAALLPYAPHARLLLAGSPASHYDLDADIGARSLGPYVATTGYLESEEELTAHIVACDVGINLRWPTAREVSGPWLRCLAVGLPTIVIDLAHVDVPSLDPRTWQVNAGGETERTANRPPSRAQNSGALRRGLAEACPPRDSGGQAEAGEPRTAVPVCVAIDIVDEDHSLRLAMRRLAKDAELRESLGRAAAEWWRREHAPERMIEDYRRIIPLAMTKPAPRPMLPRHLVNDGSVTLRALLKPFGITEIADLKFHSPRYYGIDS